MDKAGKQYLVRFVGSMVVYAILLPLAVMLAQRMEQSPWRFAVMVAPVIPVGFALAAFVVIFEKMDEMQQRIHLLALAISAGGTAMLGLTYGLLEIAGLPHLNWVWVFPIIVGLWGIGVAIASRRYA